MSQGHRPVDQYKLRVDRFDFNVRLKSLFFPLEFKEIVELLEAREFTILKEVQERIPQVPVGAKLVIGGIIAEKQNILFRINQELGIIGMQGTNIEEVITEYEQFEAVAKNTLNVDLMEESRFYEIISELVIIAKKDPIVVISKIFDGHNTLRQLSAILEIDVTNFGIRLVPTNRAPTDEEWLEYKIEPLIAKPHTSYQSSIIFRSIDKEKVKVTASNLLRRIQIVLDAIENK
jgi:hypothetical protein